MKRIDGMEVGNGTYPLTLQVTEADVKNGAPKNPNACAIAVAAMRQLKGVTAAKVHLGVLYLLQRGRWRRWQTSGPARTELIVFDRGGRFAPGVYDFLPPSTGGIIKRVAPKTAAATARTRQRLPRRKPHRVEDVRDDARGNDEAARMGA
jgi:hypothetical protein